MTSSIFSLFWRPVRDPLLFLRRQPLKTRDHQPTIAIHNGPGCICELSVGETNDALRHILTFSPASGWDQAIGDASVVFRGDLGRHLGPNDAGPDLKHRQTAKYSSQRSSR